MSAGLVAGVAVGGLLVGPALDAVSRRVPAGAPLRPLPRPDRRTAGVSVATGVLAGFVAVADGAVAVLPAHLWLAALAVVLTATDLEHRRLPNLVVVPGAVGLAVLLVLAGLLDAAPGALLRAGLAGAALFGVFLVLALISPAGMGMGDVKLAGVLGLALGYASWDAVLLGMLAAFVVHAVLSVVLLLGRRVGRRSALPFGPALLLGTGLALGWAAPLLGR